MKNIALSIKGAGFHNIGYVEWSDAHGRKSYVSLNSVICLLGSKTWGYIATVSRAETCVVAENICNKKVVEYISSLRKVNRTLRS